MRGEKKEEKKMKKTKDIRKESRFQSLKSEKRTEKEQFNKKQIEEYKKEQIFTVEELKSCYMYIKQNKQMFNLKEIEMGFLPDKFFEELNDKINRGEFKFEKKKKTINQNKNDNSSEIDYIKEAIILQAIKNKLESIYEPEFSNCSHGYRSALYGGGVVTAINNIKTRFIETDWFMTSNLSVCLNNINKKILFNSFKTYITNNSFISLLDLTYNAGYMNYNSLVKPDYNILKLNKDILYSIICNIYLDILDKRIIKEMNMLYKEVQDMEEEMNKTNKEISNFAYIRYGEEILIGIKGNRLIFNKYYEKLILIIGEIYNCNKNIRYIITQTNKSDSCCFIGFDISMSFEPLDIKKRKIIIKIPIMKLVENLKIDGYCKENNIPTSKGKLIHLPNNSIVNYYSNNWLQYLKYYSICQNRKALKYIHYILLHSCALTLAIKLKLKTKHKVFKKFGPLLTITDNNKIISSFPPF